MAKKKKKKKKKDLLLSCSDFAWKDTFFFNWKVLIFFLFCHGNTDTHKKQLFA